jgi:hypothetical protein
MRRETRDDFLSNIGYNNVRKIKETKKMTNDDLENIIDNTSDKQLKKNTTLDEFEVNNKINSLLTIIKDLEFTKAKLHKFNL